MIKGITHADISPAFFDHSIKKTRISNGDFKETDVEGNFGKKRAELKEMKIQLLKIRPQTHNCFDIEEPLCSGSYNEDISGYGGGYCKDNGGIKVDTGVQKCRWQ